MTLPSAPIVLKFGGTSVGSPAAIKSALQIIRNEAAGSRRVAVVVSALSGVTNDLIRISEQASRGEEQYLEALKALEQRHVELVQALIPATSQSSTLAALKMWFNDLADVLHGVALVWELSKRCLDFVMSFGERFSATIIADALRAQGVEARFQDAREIIFTDESFGAAHVDFERTNQAVRSSFETHPSLPIITGFIAATPRGETITLGRGGSDYTASIVGAALQACEIQIWTDVDGVMTADPRKVKKAFAVPSMSYEEAMELSHFGAKVIYPPTMLPALEAGIPIRIRNTFNPASAGTIIGAQTASHEFLATGISSIEHIALLRVQGSGMVGVAGVSKRVFSALADHLINIILITQASSEHTICFAVSPQDAPVAKQAIEHEFDLEIRAGLVDPVVVESDLSIVSVVGENMRRTPGISGKVFSALGRNGINIAAIAQGSSELNISVAINRIDESKALNALHDGLFLSETKTINLFIVGAGLIGGTLLKQIRDHQASLRTERHVEVNLLGLAKSKRMVIHEPGIPLHEWDAILDTHGVSSDISHFIDQMIALNVSHSVFVDCTANPEVTAHYARVLDASIPVVTPNKKAQSGPWGEYDRLKRISRKRGAPFLFETSVGAALPVIGTLRDLLKTGDRLLAIEAVLSGTLSFLFNTVSAKRSFSEVVAEARELGLTEPDPRDDLNGIDMARKLLILAREAGLVMELDEITIDAIVPKDALLAPNVDSFMQALKDFDPVFEERRSAAEKKGNKLCYIASLRDGKGKLSLEEITPEHPFYSLSGRDNIISFSTDRYRDRPLVVRGPGAGAEVTAAGVFADVMRIVDQGS